MKHYTPNHMLAPKANKSVIKILQNLSKSYQVIYTLNTICMPDIMIVVQAVLQIFN